MKDRCEYDQMVLLSISDAEITPEEQQKIDAHLTECSSCRKRFNTIKNATATVESLGISQEEFLQQSCGEYPTHLNILIRKSTMDDSIISSGNNKIALDDSIAKKSVITGENYFALQNPSAIQEPIVGITSRQSLEKKREEVPTGTLTPSQPHYQKIKPIQTGKFTIQGEFSTNLLEEEIYEKVEIFREELQNFPAKMGGVLNLQFAITTGSKTMLRLEVSITPDTEEAFHTRWAGVHAGTFSKLEKSIPQILQWLLAGEPFV